MKCAQSSCGSCFIELWHVFIGMLRMLYQVATGTCTVELLHVVLSCDMY